MTKSACANEEAHDEPDKGEQLREVPQDGSNDQEELHTEEREERVPGVTREHTTLRGRWLHRRAPVERLSVCARGCR